MKVLITGATGFIGKVVVERLVAAGDEVVILTRNIPRAALQLGNRCTYHQWSDPNTLPPLEAFQGVDGVINLMGESLAGKRWSESQKEVLRSSRILATDNLVKAMEQLPVRPKVLVSGSAIGIYGDRGSEELNENSALGQGFLAQLCQDWEASAQKAVELGMRVVLVRTGLVLGKGGGALEKMLPPFRMGLGGPLGSGQQYMSWIHLDDIVGLFIECLKNPGASGPFNGTTPYPATNKEFTKALGKALRRPVFIPAPAFILKLALGEMSEMLLTGQRVLPMRAKEVRFRWRAATLDLALKETVH